MKTQFIVQPEAEGVTDTGRRFKGVVVALGAGEKGIARCYIPDTFNPDKGREIAETRLRIKLAREAEKEACEDYDMLMNAHARINDARDKAFDRAMRKVERQEELRKHLFNVFGEN